MSSGQTVTETAEFWADDGVANDRFGRSVSLSGGTAVVGAYLDVHNPGQVGSPLFNEGSAHVVEWSGGNGGSDMVKLVAGDPHIQDNFGWSVDIDGDTVVVGAPGDDLAGLQDAGSAYVFARDAGGPGAWGQVAKLTAAEPAQGANFGGEVSISGDTIAVSARLMTLSGSLVGAGAVYIFERDAGGPGAWGEVERLQASDAVSSGLFGGGVTLEGDTLAVGASRPSSYGSETGAVYLFGRVPGPAGSWSEVTKLETPDALDGDRFGLALDLSGDGLVVSASQDEHQPGVPGSINGQGAAYVFRRDLGGPAAWGVEAKLIAAVPSAGSYFGSRVAISGDRVVACNVLLDQGTFVFERPGSPGVWAQRYELAASDNMNFNWFGSSVAMSAGRVLVGAENGDPGTSVNVQAVDGLAYDSLAGRLFGTDNDHGLLVELDPSTGVARSIGGLGLSEVHGLAFDPLAGVLYGSDTGTDQLLRIEPTTGGAIPIGPLGFGEVEALAFDPNFGGGTLFGVDTATDQLLTIDTSTGIATAVGPTGFARIRGLSYDDSSGLLFGADTPTDQLVSLDPVTGAATAVGPLGFAAVRGLADVPGSGLYAVDASTEQLLSVDVSLGAATAIGGFVPPPVGDSGSAYLFDLSFPGTTYCTAGASASGCSALLNAHGTPSASAISGFVVGASEVEGSKDGLFFFGSNGRQANPWGNGTSLQCVVPPVTRAPLLSGGGSPGSCDGSFELDFNAYWCPTCPKADRNPGSGTTVQAQLWYRDPQNTSNQTTSLSNALEFTLAP